MPQVSVNRQQITNFGHFLHNTSWLRFNVADFKEPNKYFTTNCNFSIKYLKVPSKSIILTFGFMEKDNKSEAESFFHKLLKVDQI